MTIKVAFVDLDGVINAVSDVRKHLVPQYTDRSSYWAEWHKAHVNEPINQAAVQMVRELHAAGHRIVFLSNRQDTCRWTTLAQLNGAFGPCDIDAGVALRNPLDDTPPPQYKARAVSLYLDGLRTASRDESIKVSVYDDSADVLIGVSNDFGVQSQSKDPRVTVFLHHLATFTGEIK